MLPVLLLLVVLVAHSSDACSCIKPTLQNTVSTAEKLVKVQVTEEIDSGIDFDDSENQTYYREYRATVLQVFIGEVSETEIVIKTPGHDELCGLILTTDTWLLELVGNQVSPTYVELCDLHRKWDFDLDDELQSLMNPSEYDISLDVELTEVRDQGFCHVSAAFALNTALEIAHYKVTGEKIRFSEQEYVDCTFRGCQGSHLQTYVTWLQVIDRLAAWDQYTGYGAVEHTCRAGLSPNSLSAIKVTGLSSITTRQFEHSILTKGIVLACMDNSHENCHEFEGYSGGTIEGDGRTDIDSNCRHTVAIIGYTADTYKVRNTWGADWGEDGYFRIKRGGNVCGIENEMYVLETESRKEEGSFIEGCPPAFPIYCEDTRTCMEPGQECIKANTEAYLDHFNEALKYKNPRSTRRKRSEEHSPCEDHKGYKCKKKLKSYCHIERVRNICGKTCGVPCPTEEAIPDELPESCKDQFPERCGDERLMNFCEVAPDLRIICPETCQVPFNECSENVTKVSSPHIAEGYPAYGHCYRPYISNGRVMNVVILHTGDQLAIRCDEGYTLVGARTYCEIQNVFRPDSRILPECIAVGGENFTGAGADYSGTQSVSGHTNVHSCGNWKELLYTGRFTTVEHGNGLKGHGNHNYCRSRGPQDFAPYCMTFDGQFKEFCFRTPNCGGGEADLCSSVRVNDPRFETVCNFKSKCEAPDERHIKRALYYFTNCGAMCCEHVGCQ